MHGCLWTCSLFVVISFAGDALICVFTSILAVDATKEEHEKDYCCRAIHCAHALRNHYTDQLTSHIGVSCGNMSFANLGGYKQSWVYMVNGACIPELSQCIDDASSKQVVVTSAVFANITRGLLPDETVQAVRLPSGNYRVDSMSTATTPPPTHSRFYYVKEINRITEYSKRFVPRPALDSINSGTFHLLSELREVTTMFLKLDTYNPENNRDPLTLQEFFYMAQIALHNTGGFMRQFLIDDKGCVLIGMWGVPSCSFPQNASRALNCAMSIRAGTHKLNHKCSIGITTGNVFCGNIGSLVRRDFVGIGHTVNLAARLMGKSKGSIFIDEETYSYLPVDFRNQLRASERFQVKGVSEPIIAYICDQNIDLNFLDVTKSGQAKKSYLPMKIAEALRKHIEIMKNSLNQDRVSMMVNNAPTMMELQNIMSTQCKSNVYITIIEGVQGSGKSAGALYYKSLAKKSGLKVCQFRAKDVDENTSYGVIRRLFLALLGEKVFQAGIEAQKQLLTALVVNIPWDKILPGENGNSMSAPRGDQSHSSASYCDPAILVEFRKAKEYSEHEQVCALALALGLLSLLGQLEAEEVVHENEGTIHSERTPGSTASKPPMSAATVECLMALSLQHLIKKIAHCVAIEDMNYCDAASWRCIYILLQTPLHAIFLFTTRNFRGRTGKDKRISNVGMSCMCNSKKAALNAVENNDDHNSSTSVTEDYHVRQSDRNKAKIETYCKIINHSNTILLEMAPLKFKEVKKLVEQSLRKHQIILSSATVQLILEISSGNVFWCQEIANFIMERGLEEFEAKIDAGVTDDEKTVTNPLQVLVICRLEKLTTEQQVALRHAALIDLEFSLLLLIAILPPKLAANIDSIMKALVNASFIELSPDDSDMFIFSNANIRQILCYLTPPR